MNQDQLNQVRRQLARGRERAVRSLARLTNGARGPSSSETSGWLPAFEASDQARDAAEKETSLLLATKEAQLLHQIDAALTRLDDEPETFGYCQRCGAEIPFARIEALPHTRYCLACKLRPHEPS
jgi:DnaK suppressor protein